MRPAVFVTASAAALLLVMPLGATWVAVEPVWGVTARDASPQEALDDGRARAADTVTKIEAAETERADLEGQIAQSETEIDSLRARADELRAARARTRGAPLRVQLDRKTPSVCRHQQCHRRLAPHISRRPSAIATSPSPMSSRTRPVRSRDAPPSSGRATPNSTTPSRHSFRFASSSMSESNAR